MGKSKSKTQGSHKTLGGSKVHKTTISKGSKKVTGYGYTPERSQKSASKKWNKGGGKSSGCIVSTACVRALGLPDDCNELQTLRRFRDSYVLSLPNGVEEVDRYYEIAAKLVNVINCREDSHLLYCSVFKDMVVPCVALVQSGERTRAFQLYKEQIEQLANTIGCS